MIKPQKSNLPKISYQRVRRFAVLHYPTRGQPIGTGHGAKFRSIRSSLFGGKLAIIHPAGPGEKLNTQQTTSSRVIRSLLFFCIASSVCCSFFYLNLRKKGKGRQSLITNRIDISNRTSIGEAGTMERIYESLPFSAAKAKWKSPVQQAIWNKLKSGWWKKRKVGRKGI